MKKRYEVELFNDTANEHEWLETMVFFRPRFSARDFKELVLISIFQYAAESIDYKNLSGSICCDGDLVLNIKSDVTVDGSTIYSDVSLARPDEAYRHYRRMFIAD